MTKTPKDVDLYIETTSEQDLVKLRLERADLLARYLPDSRVVQDVERKIAQLEGFLKAAPAQGLRGSGPIRRGRRWKRIAPCRRRTSAQ